MTDLSGLLKKNPVFSFLSENDMDLMARQSTARPYGKNEKVILYGHVWP